jgi:lipopolysaccharide exporter
MALARKAAVDVVWNLTTSVGSRIITLGGTLWLTYLLSPDVYGEVTLAAIVVQTAAIVGGSGLPQYVFAKPEMGQKGMFHVTFFYLLIGVVVFAPLLLLRDLVGGPFQAPTMGRFIPGLMIAGMLDRTSTMPDRVQTRDMRFRAISVQRTVRDLTFAAVSVGLAVLGWGGFAIVAASIARSSIRLLMVLATTRLRDWFEPCRLEKRLSLDVLAFGLPMTVVQVTGAGARQWDNLVFASLFGAGPQALYNQAYNLADVPTTHVGEMVIDVLTPSFAKLPAERRPAALIRAMSLLIMIISPLSVGLGAVGTVAAAACLDKKWQGAGPMLTILAALSIFRPASLALSSYLQVFNRPRAVMAIEIFKVVLLLLGVRILGQLGGQLWACCAVGVAFTVSTFQYLWVIRRFDDIPLGKAVMGFARPITACLPMVIAILAFRRVSPFAAVPRLELLVEILIGALVYIPSAFLFAREAASDLLRLLLDTLRRRRSAEPAEGSAAPPAA